MGDGLIMDFVKTLREMDPIYPGFLCRKISRMMEKNKFGIFYDRNDELTEIGEVVAGLYELLFVHGVLKFSPGGGVDE